MDFDLLLTILALAFGFLLFAVALSWISYFPIMCLILRRHKPEPVCQFSSAFDCFFPGVHASYHLWVYLWRKNYRDLQDSWVRLYFAVQRLVMIYGTILLAVAASAMIAIQVLQ